MTAEFGKVAVLLGGPSAEREVSLMSGNGVLAALREKGVDAHPFDPAQRDLFDLKREGFTRVFIALHGRFGEDGTVQGALETLGIPYTGSGVMGSALATDKWRTKLIWLASGIPTPKYRVVDARTDWMRVVAELGLPLIVKPAREGSTIGITKVAKIDHDEMALAYADAAKHDSLVLVEEFVTGAELTASIVNGRALPLIRIEAPQGNYDYHAKYFSDETKYHCPAGLPDAQEKAIRAMAMRAYLPGSQHLAWHDRTQSGADGGKAGGDVLPGLVRGNSEGRPVEYPHARFARCPPRGRKRHLGTARRCPCGMTRSG
jgi:D-alanine-D-alanine ligase